MNIPDRRTHDRRIRLVEVAGRAEPTDDFNPAEWAAFQKQFNWEVENSAIEPAETPYGPALHLAESYYLLHPTQRTEIADSLPKPRVREDVEHSLRRGYAGMPAEFQVFFPEDALYPLSEEEYWPKMKAWMDKLEKSQSPDMYVEQVINAIRLFPNKRAELEHTAEYWLQRFEGGQAFPVSYIKNCSKIILLFPSVLGHVREFMRQHVEGLKKDKSFSTPDLSMQATLKILEGKIVLQPDGQFGFANKGRLTSMVNLPPRDGI